MVAGEEIIWSTSISTNGLPLHGLRVGLPLYKVVVIRLFDGVTIHTKTEVYCKYITHLKENILEFFIDKANLPRGVGENRHHILFFEKVLDK